MRKTVEAGAGCKTAVGFGLSSPKPARTSQLATPTRSVEKRSPYKGMVGDSRRMFMALPAPLFGQARDQFLTRFDRVRKREAARERLFICSFYFWRAIQTRV